MMKILYKLASRSFRLASRCKEFALLGHFYGVSDLVMSLFECFCTPCFAIPPSLLIYPRVQRLIFDRLLYRGSCCVTR